MQPESKGHSPDSANSSSFSELLQHQQDAARLELIQQQIQQADDICQQVAQPAGFKPTAEQQDSIDGILSWINSNDGLFSTFTGPAGSGKSTTTRLIRQALLNAGRTVGLAAPTHKACGVLAAACNVPKSHTATFASLLALREKKKRDQVEFVRDYNRKPRIDEAEVWICDEASMLEPVLLKMLEQEADFWTRFIFVGDPAQLPPVDHGKVSPALRCTPRFELTEVLRHDGAVLDAATRIRKTTGSKYRVPFFKTVIGDGSAIHTYADKREWQRAILETAAEHHDADDPDAFRVLTYRRDEAAKINLAIRRHVRGLKADPFLKGERLITVEAVNDPADPNGMPLYGSSRELVIQECQPGEFMHPTCADGKPYRCWELLTLADGPEEVPQYLRVIDPSNDGKLAVAQSLLRREALTKPKGEQGAWNDFWELKAQFAVLQPHWAMTVHKSQGSQFRHVFIGPDLDQVPGPRNLTRHLWYTAFTRAQQAVHVIGDREVGNAN